MEHSVTTFSTTAVCLKLSTTLNITLFNDIASGISLTVILTVIINSVIILSVFMLSVFMMSTSMLNGIMLSVVMLDVIMISAVMLNASTLSVIIQYSEPQVVGEVVNASVRLD